MVAVYFVLVAVYFLFGYLFLPDRICATGWYFGGAALFPVVVFVFIGILIGKGIIKPPPPKEKVQHDIQQSKPPSSLPQRSSPPPPVSSSSDFENRLLRARTEPLVFLQQQLMNGVCVSADVRNEQSGNTYHVTPESCDCEDFKKCGQPCKHMIYLAIKTGDFLRYEKPLPTPPPKYTGDNFIPFYGRYYSGPPTGIGYKNLYPYRVIGRVYGTSEKTGRPTNRKKEITVNARSLEDAQTAAEAMGVSPPYAEISMLDVSPSYNQLSYLHAVGIPFPFFVTADDVSALLTRHQWEQDDLCPRGLLDMATARRVGVSYFASPQSVVSQIWYCAPPGERAALFCYAAYCRELGCEIGCAPFPYTDGIFQSFAPTQRQ